MPHPPLPPAVPPSSTNTEIELLATPAPEQEKQSSNQTVDNVSDGLELMVDVLDCISDVGETVVSTAGEVLSAVGQGIGSVLEGLG